MDKDIISQEEIDMLLSMEDSDDKPEILPDADVMSKTRETSKPASKKGSKGSGDIISQDEIDMLFDNAPGETKPPGKSPTEPDSSSPDGIMGQDDIDMLLNEVSGETDPPDMLSSESDSSSSGDIMGQDEIDSMLEGALLDDEPEQSKSGGKSSDSGSIMSQNDIDDMLNSFLDTPGEKKPSKPATPAFSPPPDKPSTIDINSLLVPQKTEKRYKLYDFRRPEKLSRDQVRRMKAKFEPVPRHLMNYLAKLLRSRIEVNLIEIDQRNYGDIFGRTSNPTIIGVFRLGPDKTDGIIEFSTHLFYCIIERLMGGSGTGITPIRPITDFERYMATDIFNSILQYYKDILANLVSIDPRIDVIESDRQLIPKTLSEDEILVRNIYEVKINGISGYLNISIPYSFIGHYFARFNNMVKKMGKDKLDISTKFVRKGMGHIRIPVYAEFNKKDITAGEAIELSRGSIIMLDHHRNTHLKVNVNGRTKFMGVPGLKGNKISIKITQVVEDDEELCQAF